jgi:pimeloyl-ACP methyl ester carboxylesterase
MPLETNLPEPVLAAIQTLTEITSLALAQQIQRQAVATPLQTDPIPTAYVCQGPGGQGLGGQGLMGQGPVNQGPGSERATPLVLLPGFDSSLLEYRRLLPRLAQTWETWTIDLLGFGFTDRPPGLKFSPATLLTHLHACWQQLIKKPMILVGASMGGTAAIEFALAYPEAVHRLILLDSAGIKQGPVLGRYLFPPLDRWAVEILRNPDVRSSISRTAYYQPDLWVTPDAERCAMIHLLMPNWNEALRSFTKSGGFKSVRKRLDQITMETLVIWGRQDKILGKKDADQLSQRIPHSHLTWIEQAGHVPHLEQSQAVAEAILQFCNVAHAKNLEL